jgi:hypothetical protein
MRIGIKFLLILSVLIYMTGCSSEIEESKHSQVDRRENSGTVNMTQFTIGQREHVLVIADNPDQITEDNQWSEASYTTVSGAVVTLYPANSGALEVSVKRSVTETETYQRISPFWHDPSSRIKPGESSVSNGDFTINIEEASWKLGEDSLGVPEIFWSKVSLVVIID